MSIFMRHAACHPKPYTVFRGLNGIFTLSSLESSYKADCEAVFIR